MTPELRLLVGFALASALAFLAAPLAIRLAGHLDFYDRPHGYKAHAEPTPYLGGVALMSAFVLAVAALAGDAGRTLPVLGGVALLAAVGTLDDRRHLSPVVRVLTELAVATGIWAADLGWDLGLGAVPDLLLTQLWVVGVVNAFNLFDNMDGAAGTMGLVAGVAVAVLGVVQDDTWLAVAGGALAGACLGFLPYNLASPARIFLGDGGSMPLGFAVAALVMIGASEAAGAWQGLVMGLLMVGVPALDTALVVVSRTRRGVSVLTGGRDHLTHRAQTMLRSARGVALVLGSAQALLAAVAIVAIEGESFLILLLVALYVVAAVAAITVLDAAALTIPAAVLLAPLGVGLAVSPFAGGYYDSSIWVPAGLGLLVVLTAFLVARAPRPPARATAAVLGLAGLAALSLLSATWTDSIQQAVLEGNRFLVYAAALGLLVLLVADDRSATWLLASIGTGAAIVAAVVVARLLEGDETLMLGGRLHEPLEYVNGQASLFVLALWPCLALAEQRRSAALAGLGLGLATLLASLVVLAQSRGAVLATVLSAIVVVVALPHRLRRIWALLVLAGCVAAVLPTLLDVYELGSTGRAVDEALTDAAVAALLASGAAGIAWGAIVGAGTTITRARPRLADGLRGALGGLVTLLAVGAAVAGVASTSRIADYVDRQYDTFVTLGGLAGEPTGSRLVAGAGNRYDYWRVAVDAWRDDPVLGIGAGGYDKPYFAQRSTTEDIRQPHSLPLQVLTELGLLGAAVLLLFLATVAVGARTQAVRAKQAVTSAPIAVGALGIFAAWLVHASVDWIHLLPGLTGIALAGAAILLRAPGAGGDPHPRAEPARRPAVTALLVGIALAAAAFSLSRQALSEHYRDDARGQLTSDPARALEQANRSLRLDREDVRSYYVKAAALARFGEAADSRAVLLDAARREPRDFVTWALLGDLAVRRGRLPEARGHYSRAARLNPRDRTLKSLARDPRRALRGSART
jgi:UDP-GlcNAc:undecaprenyl-phosphate GlcNAc-1-phosphate transferase